MEKELTEIHDKFQCGKHKQAVNELKTLIDKSEGDSLLYRVHDRLGDYLNFMGEHSEAIKSWSNALTILENSPGGIDQLNEQKFYDWINISPGIAKIVHRQGLFFVY